jgi:ABC-type transport system substrate-binding protein
LLSGVTSCALGGGTSTPAEVLANDQTLSFPISQDVADFDPAQITAPADVDILRNVFSGLYRFDDKLHLVPDLATSLPEISADGVTTPSTSGRARVSRTATRSPPTTSCSAGTARRRSRASSRRCSRH